MFDVHGKRDAFLWTVQCSNWMRKSNMNNIEQFTRRYDDFEVTRSVHFIILISALLIYSNVKLGHVRPNGCFDEIIWRVIYRPLKIPKKIMRIIIFIITCVVPSVYAEHWKLAILTKQSKPGKYLFSTVLSCQSQLYSLMKAFIKVLNDLVTLWEDNVLLWVFQSCYNNVHK